MFPEELIGRRKPSPRQMRALHIVAKGKLVAPRKSRWFTYELTAGDEDFTFQTGVSTIMSLQRSAWLRVINANDRHREYQVSELGKKALAELCAHKHSWMWEETAEIIAGALLCKKCWRSLPCRSRKKPPHASSQWNEKYGPMCDECVRLVFRTR